MLSDEVHNAPTVIALLNVLERERSHLRASQPAAEQHREHRPVTQSLLGGDVRRVQEFLGLLDREPVADPHAHRLGALDARDAGGQFRRQQPVVGRLDRQLPNGGDADVDGDGPHRKMPQKPRFPVSTLRPARRTVRSKSQVVPPAFAEPDAYPDARRFA